MNANQHVAYLQIVFSAFGPIGPRSDWSEGAEYDLQIGDMLVRIHNGEVATDTLYMELYVSVVAPMSLARLIGATTDT